MSSSATVQKRSLLADAKRTRVGMLYALLGAPALGLAFSLLSVMVGGAPFNMEYPTGGFAIVTLLQLPFGFLAISVFLLVTGQWRDAYRLLGHRISWWAPFTGIGGMFGDFSYAIASVLIGGALAGPIGSLYGVVGAIITSVLYREKILRWSTIVGLLALGGGVWLVLSGGELVSPTQGIYLVVGVLIMLGSLATWGFENFAVAAGSDLMPPEGFVWWRAAAAGLLALPIMFILFPTSRQMAVEIWSDPQIVAYGAVIGISWAMWILLSYYLGVAYAGGVRGGVLGATFGFFFIGFFSVTIYNLPFSWAIIIGASVMFIGGALIVSEPGAYLARKRSSAPGAVLAAQHDKNVDTLDRKKSERLIQEYLRDSRSYKNRRLTGVVTLCVALMAVLSLIYFKGWYSPMGSPEVVVNIIVVGIIICVGAIAATLIDRIYRFEL